MRWGHGPNPFIYWPAFWGQARIWSIVAIFAQSLVAAILQSQAQGLRKEVTSLTFFLSTPYPH